jgi:circadian clock protein KaiC
VITPVSLPVDPLASPERASTGIPGLDPLLEGGFPLNRAMLLCGEAGTGKTTCALQFLIAGIQRGDAGAFVSVDEKPRHLIDDAIRLGLPVQAAIDAGTLMILDAAPYFTATRGKQWTRPGVDARQVAADLVHQLRKISARRLVIDSITSLVPPDMGRAQANDYLRSLVHSLEDNLGSTILLTCRGSRLDSQGACESARYLASGVIELRLDARHSTLRRTLRIRKMRGAPVAPGDYRIEMEGGVGLSIAESLERRDVSVFRPRPRSVAVAAPQPSDRPAAV